MRLSYALSFLLIALLASGCALGKKEWPNPQQSEDAFTLEVLAAERTDDCLVLKLAVTGAVERLYRASIEYEVVGDGDGEGCQGCPFVPRGAKHIARNSSEFDLKGNTLSISLCGLDPQKTYRFRVAGKSELPTNPLVYTGVYVTTDQ